MTLAKFVIIITIALTTIAVALIVGAVILKEKEQGTKQTKMQCGGVVKHKPVRESEWVFPLTRSRVICWIPVEERLPDNTRHVLVSVKYAKGVDSIRIAYWHNQEWQGAIVGKVLAWAELPEPYKK